MKKNEFKFEELEVANVETEARMVPLTIGDELHFTLSKNLTKARKELIGGVTREWTDVQTDDSDIAVSASQLTRRNNGLTLTGKTIRERLESFTDLFSEEGTLTLKITKVVEREFTDDNGKKSTSRYLKFATA